ncbi:TRAP transporter small permease [Rhodospirillaceae bacterium SYSU D60014]|uniref:TRAP transporter small permease subunit n=1 Tax=Virgifigura deserti TaxID=2268457 RepID=UPI000E661B5A
MNNDDREISDRHAMEELSDTDAGQQPIRHSGQEGHLRTGFDRAIDKAGVVLAWLVFAAALISVYEVVMRYAFDNPTSWVHETTVFLIALIFAIGGPVALARDKHIRVRLLYDAASPRVRRALDIFNALATLLFLAGLTYAGLVMSEKAFFSPTGAFQLERSGTSWNPVFPALIKGVILLAAIIMVIQTILHLVGALRTKGYDDKPARQEN